MLKRALTALGILSVVGLAVFYLRSIHIVFADLIIVLFALVGTYELAKCFNKGENKVMAIPLIITALIIYPIVYFMYEIGIVISLAVGAVAALTNLVIKHDKYELKSFNSTLTCMIYPLSIMMLMVVINHKTGNMLGLFLIFAVAVLTDTMAYLVGVTFKGPKLCPSVSPKKTISGAVGGLIGGIMGAVLTWILFDKFNLFAYMNDSFVRLFQNIWLSLGIYFIIGLVAAISAMFGDLGASVIKRKMEIKDYGNIFPGHGGVMDRIDSFLFVIPLVYVILAIIEFV